MATLDVLVPCYRYGRFLRACVASVQAQPVDFRILIIDDASPDDTREIAEDLAREDRRISVVSHPRNRGHIATYNEGIEWASAECFLILSADDLIAPHALTRALALFEAHPQAVLTYGGCLDLAAEAPVPTSDAGAADEAWRVRSGHAFIEETCATAFDWVATPTAIVRTAAQKEAGYYRAELPHAGDMEMWLRLAVLGDVADTKAIQAFRRIHGANMSLTAQDVVARDYLQREAVFAYFFGEAGARLSDAPKLRRLAEHRLAERAFWTGVAQVCRGNRQTGKDLLALACRLRPHTLYAPPLAQLLRMSDPHRRLASVLSHVVRGGGG
jgi:glycosyltransferase involved in cell wall biosynthesis